MVFVQWKWFRYDTVHKELTGFTRMSSHQLFKMMFWIIHSTQAGVSSTVKIFAKWTFFWILLKPPNTNSYEIYRENVSESSADHTRSCCCLLKLGDDNHQHCGHPNILMIGLFCSVEVRLEQAHLHCMTRTVLLKGWQLVDIKDITVLRYSLCALHTTDNRAFLLCWSTTGKGP